jgi:hypothetical protein
MSIQKARIAGAGQHMLREKAMAVLQKEATKGCLPDLSGEPISIVPRFCSISDVPQLLKQETPPHAVAASAPPAESLARVQIWISPQQDCKWHRSESFLKQMQLLSSPAALEIVGNQETVTVGILCPRRDIGPLSVAFRSEFELCRLAPPDGPMLSTLQEQSWGDICFRDYYPPPPYSELISRLDELKSSPYERVMTAMMAIPSPAVAVYQVLFQPVPTGHDWCNNVRALQDLRYKAKLLDGPQPNQRYPQQAPSGDRVGMAQELQTKAHNDKPFYATALRVAVIGARERGPEFLRYFSTFSHLFQHGGQQLKYVGEEEYREVLSPSEIRDMFLRGLTYRPGFLLNSWELTGLVHVPQADVLEDREVPVITLEPLSPAQGDLTTGTLIGTCRGPRGETGVHIPPRIRGRHVHLIGKPGMGKSTTLERMILQDIEQGHGVAVLDPHGGLVKKLLRLIPKEHIGRTIYFDPGDPEWVPLWNPACLNERHSAGRVAGDLVAALQTLGGGWGHRLETMLRQSLSAVLRLPQSSLFDASLVLRKNSDEGKKLREEIRKISPNEVAQQFWKNDFGKYRWQDLSPPQHRLNILLGEEDTVCRMLSQHESAIDLRQIMDEGKILLCDLSTIGLRIAGGLGSFLLALLHQAAVSRSDTVPGQRKQFHIYCDEAHRFLTQSLEDILAEARKFKVSMTLAHQFGSQMDKQKRDALSSTGSAVIFNVDSRDARFLSKDLRGEATAEDIVNLEQYQAIARIGLHVVRLNTLPPVSPPENSFAEEIIRHSHNRYYRPAPEVDALIRSRSRRWEKPYTPLTEQAANPNDDDPEEFGYEEL